ncbi:hypothetical protein [Seonamhaeicola maritimus]|uniref:Uncharacterized protein n=1 Tax=Seonamhaeicola maritimus TaxID=2591822 RepID=A0A5C7GMG5_9FLAO|nr:hypothetical protein [Seonamhaeicola maritimus]TXG39465.1 hypothetical protein FUA22_06230 [Seonamhaeicola maritimus]
MLKEFLVMLVEGFFENQKEVTTFRGILKILLKVLLFILVVILVLYFLLNKKETVTVSNLIFPS